jgi:hypothetical protein
MTTSWSYQSSSRVRFTVLRATFRWRGAPSADVRRDSVARRVGLPPIGVGARANPSRCRDGHMQGGSYVSPARTFGRRAGTRWPAFVPPRARSAHARPLYAGLCAAGIAPSRTQRDSTCSVGRPPQRPQPWPHGGRSPLQLRSAPECRRREGRGGRCTKAPSARWFC